MVPSDSPDDKDKGFNSAEDADNSGVPRLKVPTVEDARTEQPFVAPHFVSGDIPDLASDDIDDDLKNDLKADTLEFERINRRAKPKRAGLKFILLILVVSAGGYAAWAQWGAAFFGRNADELPIVRAAEKPLKVRPEKPGGIEIPNRDKLVYDRLEKKPPAEKTENLLPRPETPLSPPAPKPVEQAEVTVKPEAKPKVPKATGSQPTVAEVKAVAKPAPAPVPPKVAKKVAAVKSPPTGSVITPKSYQIQLAAVRTAGAAKGEWARLQKKHPRLLGKLSLNVVRADLGSKGIFYRLRAGPLADQGSAKALCQSLASQKVGCLIIRPGK